MISSTEVVNLIRGFSTTERLKIVEEILRNIREENNDYLSKDHSKNESFEPAILNFAGIITEKEADVLRSAVAESRKIDRNEW